MPTPTYDALASTTLSSSASSVTFSNLNTIAAGYRDLVLVIQAKATDSGTFELRFNGDSAGNYFWVYMNGTGSSTTSIAASGNTRIVLNPSSLNNLAGDPFYIGHISIMDFATTDKHKSVLVRANQANTNTTAYSGRWANTAAINSLEVSMSTNQIAAGSTFSLYGIVAV